MEKNRVMACQVNSLSSFRLESSAARPDTWRGVFRISTAANPVMAVATLAAILMASNASASRPAARNSANRDDVGSVPQAAVSIPLLNNGQVAKFAVEVVIPVLTMDFKNWSEDIAEVLAQFQRHEGWKVFLVATERHSALDFVRECRLVSTVVANRAAVSTSESASGSYCLAVPVPLRMAFESADDRCLEEVMAEVVDYVCQTGEPERGRKIRTGMR